MATLRLWHAKQRSSCLSMLEGDVEVKGDVHEVKAPLCGLSEDNVPSTKLVTSSLYHASRPNNGRQIAAQRQHRSCSISSQEELALLGGGESYRNDHCYRIRDIMIADKGAPDISPFTTGVYPPRQQFTVMLRNLDGATNESEKSVQFSADRQAPSFVSNASRTSAVRHGLLKTPGAAQLVDLSLPIPPMLSREVDVSQNSYLAEAAPDQLIAESSKLAHSTVCASEISNAVEEISKADPSASNHPLDLNYTEHLGSMSGVSQHGNGQTGIHSEHQHTESIELQATSEHHEPLNVLSPIILSGQGNPEPQDELPLRKAAESKSAFVSATQDLIPVVREAVEEAVQLALRHAMDEIATFSHNHPERKNYHHHIGAQVFHGIASPWNQEILKHGETIESQSQTQLLGSLFRKGNIHNQAFLSEPCDAVQDTINTVHHHKAGLITIGNDGLPSKSDNIPFGKHSKQLSSVPDRSSSRKRASRVKYPNLHLDHTPHKVDVKARLPRFKNRSENQTPQRTTKIIHDTRSIPKYKSQLTTMPFKEHARYATLHQSHASDSMENHAELPSMFEAQILNRKVAEARKSSRSALGSQHNFQAAEFAKTINDLEGLLGEALHIARRVTEHSEDQCQSQAPTNEQTPAKSSRHAADHEPEIHLLVTDDLSETACSHNSSHLTDSSDESDASFLHDLVPEDLPYDHVLQRSRSHASLDARRSSHVHTGMPLYTRSHKTHDIFSSGRDGRNGGISKDVFLTEQSPPGPTISSPTDSLLYSATLAHSLDGSHPSEAIDFDQGIPPLSDTPRRSAKVKHDSVELRDVPAPNLPTIPSKLASSRSTAHSNLNLGGKRHISLKGHHAFSLARSHRAQPIARDWSPARKRYAATVACINTALIGLLVGIYAGEVPAIQYYIVDLHHYSILGNVFMYIAMAIPTLLFWPLPLLHGRKPYILGALAIAMPLLFPQALSVGQFRSPYLRQWRVALLLPRGAMGLALGFAHMNFNNTLLDLFGASLQSTNPHQEIVDENDVRRHGGGMGAWLGIWSWCSIGTIGLGFMIGSSIIQDLPPAWGFYICIIIIAVVLVLNVITPEVRRSTYRRSLTEVKTNGQVSRRVARGEVCMHMIQTGPKWWGEEFHQGLLLSAKMLRQPGFLILALYMAWIYGQIVLVIVVSDQGTRDYEHS